MADLATWCDAADADDNRRMLNDAIAHRVAANADGKDWKKFVADLTPDDQRPKDDGRANFDGAISALNRL